MKTLLTTLAIVFALGSVSFGQITPQMRDSIAKQKAVQAQRQKIISDNAWYRYKMKQYRPAPKPVPELTEEQIWRRQQQWNWDMSHDLLGRQINVNQK